MTVDDIIRELTQKSDPANRAGLDRYGIGTTNALGIRVPDIKRFANRLRKQVTDRHATALELWGTGIFEARAVAALVDDPKQVTSGQMDSWATDFADWATVDGTCSYLFCRTPFAYEKAMEWAEREQEFVKRAGFSLMAYLAIHDKKAPDEKLAAFLPVIERHAQDDRNFIKKAANWALRQIGKRSVYLNGLSVATAERIHSQGTKSAKWIGSDALRELRSPSVQQRLAKKRP
jgi:3-methyladenine DNA glycosylase AlkD